MEGSVLGSKENISDIVSSMYDLEGTILSLYKLPKKELDILYQTSEDSDEELVLNTAAGMLLDSDNMEEIRDFYDGRELPENYLSL